MSGLRLTPAGRAHIVRLLDESNLESPVASLGRQSPPVKLSPDAVRAAVSGKNLEKLQEFAEGRRPKQYALHVFVIEAADCRAEDLCQIDGLAFCIPPGLRTLFDGHVLDVKDNRIIVVRTDGKPIAGPLRDLLYG